jgi:hypothetical protein
MQIFRRARRSIGLPESPQVRVVSRMLQQLLELSAATPEVSLQNSPISIGFPSINGLRQQHIVDAASHIGISTLSSQPLHQPQHIIAAYSGHSMDLCKPYKNEQTCIKEDFGYFQLQTTLLVEYTEDALLLHASVMREPVGLNSYDSELLAQYELGSRLTSGREGAAMVAWAILSFVRQRRERLGSPGKILVLMTGRDVRPELTEAVMHALSDLVDEVEVIAAGTEYFLARRAAELAWRAIQEEEQVEL